MTRGDDGGDWRRPAAVAGQWYPGPVAELSAAVDGFLSAVPASDSGTHYPLGLIAPHAGLVYSGAIAAHAYATLPGGDYDCVVLVGPSHYVGFEGVSVWPTGAFEMPYGPVPIAADVARALIEAAPCIHPRAEAHEREHALEMQLPFLWRTIPTVPIVPMVIGHQTRETIHALSDALVTVARDRRVLLVASSDLSHYFDRARAQRLDQRVVRCVERFDPDGVLTEMDRYPAGEFGRYVACGGGAIVAVMSAAHRLGAGPSRVLRHGDSSEVSGDTTQVVGYLAAAFERGDAT